MRTVGQITFDETRVNAIAPKVDGWVERLYVNSTGQPVAAGQPLLAIYSPMLVTAQEELLLARRLQGDVAGAEARTTRARGGARGVGAPAAVVLGHLRRARSPRSSAAAWCARR